MILLGCFLVPANTILLSITCVKHARLICLHFQKTNEDTNSITSINNFTTCTYTMIGQFNSVFYRTTHKHFEAVFVTKMPQDVFPFSFLFTQMAMFTLQAEVRSIFLSLLPDFPRKIEGTTARRVSNVINHLPKCSVCLSVSGAFNHLKIYC